MYPQKATYDIDTIVLALMSHCPTQKAFQKKKRARIPEALDEIFNSTVSKQSLKQFSKTVILGFAGPFFQNLPPEGNLHHETYVYVHTSEDKSLKKRTNKWNSNQKNQNTKNNFSP